MHKLKFTLDKNGFGKVTLDGHEIDVASMRFDHKAGDLNQVTITVHAQVEGDIEVSRLETVEKHRLSESAPCVS